MRNYPVPLGVDGQARWPETRWKPTVGTIVGNNFEFPGRVSTSPLTFPRLGLALGQDSHQCIHMHHSCIIVVLATPGYASRRTRRRRLRALLPALRLVLAVGDDEHAYILNPGRLPARILRGTCIAVSMALENGLYIHSVLIYAIIHLSLLSQQDGDYSLLSGHISSKKRVYDCYIPYIQV